jgi:hypothetical protein
VLSLALEEDYETSCSLVIELQPHRIPTPTAFSIHDPITTPRSVFN